MKFSLAFLTLAVTSVAARQLEDEDEQTGASTAATAQENIDYATMISGYSIKYNGCLVQQAIDWESASGHTNTTLVKYKLCPTTACSDESAAGCASSDYPGEYVIGLAEYVEQAMEYKSLKRETYCNQMEYQYELDQAYDESMGTNIAVAPTYPYYCEQYEKDEDATGSQQAIAEQIEGYMEGGCQELGEDENGVQYWIGYTCVDDGDKINMGMFSDEECASQVSDSYWYTLMGFSWPYGTDNIVSNYCISCKEEYSSVDGDYSAAQDNADADEVIQYCGDMYDGSIKCEKDCLSGSDTMCNYIESISMKIEEGHGVTMQGVGGSAGLTFITALFTVSTVGLAGYVWFLKEKVGRTKIDLGN